MGRVSEELLLRVCSVVDLVEPSETMIEGAKRRLLLSGADAKRTWKGEPGQFLQVGLQGFEPAEGRYDVIWVQWAMLYLTDGEKKKTGWFFSLVLPPVLSLLLSFFRAHALPPLPSRSHSLFLRPSTTTPPRQHHLAHDVPIPDDAVSFLKRAHAALRPGGVLVVKENVCSSGFVVDDSDRSLTRSHAYMLGLFEKSNVEVSRHARQRDLPKGLFGVRMYACVKKEA